MAHIRMDLSTGRRVYVQTRYGEPIVDRLKELGAHWEPASKCWWIGSGKRSQVEELLISTDKVEDDAKERGERALPPVKEDPHKIRLTGKGEYKGRSYYVGVSTRDGLRVRLLTLPNAKGEYLDFWALSSEVEITRTYTPREVWDGRRYSGRTRTEYTTLGSIAAFLARQKNPATRRGQCTECGDWGPAGEPCTGCGGEGSYC